MSFGRLPNRFGSVSKLPGKRRKPWRARKLSSFKIDHEKGQKTAVYATIGYYATKKEALDALSKISDLPEVVENRTLASVYEEWLGTHAVSEKTMASYPSRWAHLSPLHDRPIRSITVQDLEAVLSDERIPRTQKTATKQLLNMIFGYAEKRDIVFRNVASKVVVSFDTDTKIVRTIIPVAEIKAWEARHDVKYDIIVVMACTGIRTAEADQLRKADVHLEEGYFTCGVKTEAGKNRIVPIHPFILPAMQRLMQTPGDRLAVQRDVRSFIRQHTKYKPHDTRHTFATMAKKAGMDPLAVKRIMGHAVQDITEGLYTHLDLEFLMAEINKMAF